jgi:hypothetical protein
MDNTNQNAAANADATQEQPQQIDISNVEVPLTLTVAEINFMLGTVGQGPFNQVAGFINKVKGQAESYLAAVQQQQQQSGKPAQSKGNEQPFDPDGLTSDGRVAGQRGWRHTLDQIQCRVGCAHTRVPPMRAQLQACNLLMSNSRMNEMSSMTDAMAEAPA